MTQLPAASDLPDRLLAYAQWVCWRRQEREDRTTKVPINPATGRFASTTDADTWGDFEAARAYATDGPVDGLGFVFSEADPFVGIDLDDCRDPDTGALADIAHEIVERVDSYTEVSPSGTGVHVLAAGPAPEGRNRHDAVECYATARFFTMTGAHLSETPATIHDRTDALEAVYAKHLQPPAAAPEARQAGAAAAGSAGGQAADTASSASATTTGTPGDGPAAPGADATTGTDGHSTGGQTAGEAGGSGNRLTDAEVLAAAKQAANGDKFRRLWRGRTNRYPSHSEADMALCGLLAFWTGNDSQQIDRLFRRSGLMRPKWDEEHFADGSTYGEKTIERVVATTEEVYEPPPPSTGTPPATDQPRGQSATGQHRTDQPAGDSDATTATATSAAERGERTPAAQERSDSESSARAQDAGAPNTEAPTGGEAATQQATAKEPGGSNLQHAPPARLRERVRKLQAEVEWLERRRRVLRAHLEAVTDEPEADDDNASDDVQTSTDNGRSAEADTDARTAAEDTTEEGDAGRLGSLLPW